MIVSHSKKFIFIHVPKTAGTSMHSVLRKYKSNDTLLRCYAHIKAKELRDKLINNIFDDYFKFAFIRNPWDRLVSKYYDILRSKRNRYHRLVSSMKDFDKYIEWIVEDKFPKLRLQKDFLYDNEDRLMVDFLGRFENLNTDFKKICDLLNINDVALPHKKKSGRNSYKEYYNSRTQELVYNAYKADIHTFHYEF